MTKNRQAIRVAVKSAALALNQARELRDEYLQRGGIGWANAVSYLNILAIHNAHRLTLAQSDAVHAGVWVSVSIAPGQDYELHFVFTGSDDE